MQTHFRIECPECSEYILVEGNWDDADPSVGYNAYALIEQAVVECPACQHRLSDAERAVIEQRIEQHPKAFDPYYCGGFEE